VRGCFAKSLQTTCFLRKSKALACESSFATICRATSERSPGVRIANCPASAPSCDHSSVSSPVALSAVGLSSPARAGARMVYSRLDTTLRTASDVKAMRIFCYVSRLAARVRMPGRILHMARKPAKGGTCGVPAFHRCERFDLTPFFSKGTIAVSHKYNIVHN
jgi:hypothetical protein